MSKHFRYDFAGKHWDNLTAIGDNEPEDRYGHSLVIFEVNNFGAVCELAPSYMLNLQHQNCQ